VEKLVCALRGAFRLGEMLMFICTQVDKCREEKDFPPLKTFVIDVISHSSHRLEADDVEALKQAKMSSTYIRQWIVSRQNRGAGTRYT
jgi:phosphopantetheine adenylyltransferase